MNLLLPLSVSTYGVDVDSGRDFVDQCLMSGRCGKENIHIRGHFINVLGGEGLQAVGFLGPTAKFICRLAFLISLPNLDGLQLSFAQKHHV